MYFYNPPLCLLDSSMFDLVQDNILKNVYHKCKYLYPHIY